MECVCCHNEFTPPKQQPMCQGCWYSGDYLLSRMPGLVGVLNAATDGMHWRAEHTGGGCFWLICYLHGVPAAEQFENDDIGPTLVLTGEDPLGGADTVRDVEACGLWHLGFYADAISLQDGECESHYLSTEALPMKVREIARRIGATT